MSIRQLDIPDSIPNADATLALAVGLFASGHFSQGRAAAFAGLSREAFIDALSAFGVSFTNIAADDLAEEVSEWEKSRSPTPPPFSS